MTSLIRTLCVLCGCSLIVGQAGLSARKLHAEDPKPRVLMLTESRGFVHAPVKRLAGELAPSEVAMRQLSLDEEWK